jgi:hypothetical protein
LRAKLIFSLAAFLSGPSIIRAVTSPHPPFLRAMAWPQQALKRLISERSTNCNLNSQIGIPFTAALKRILASLYTPDPLDESLLLLRL